MTLCLIPDILPKHITPNIYLPENSSIKDSRSEDRVVSKKPSCRRCSIAHISDPQLNAGNTDILYKILEASSGMSER